MTKELSTFLAGLLLTPDSPARQVAAHRLPLSLLLSLSPDFQVDPHTGALRDLNSKYWRFTTRIALSR